MSATATRSAETALPSTRRGLSMSIAGLWALIALALPLVSTLSARMGTVDLAYQVRLGDLMLDSGKLVRADTFTFTSAGRPWLDQQWLAQVLMAAGHRLGGWEALVILRSALIAATFAFVYLSCRAVGTSGRVSALLSLGSFAAMLLGLALRPQLFAFALFAALVWIVSDRSKHPRRLWLAVPIVALWANIHGSFFLAPLLLGLTWFEDRRRHPQTARVALVAAAASLMATLLNPFGYRVWVYVADISTNPEITKTVSEWAAPTVKDPAGAAFFLSVAAIAVFFARRSKPVPWTTLTGLGIFLALGLMNGRGMFWWALFVPAVVAARLPEGGRPARPTASRTMVTIVVASLVLMGTAFLPWLKPGGSERWTTLLSDAPPGVTHELQGLLSPGERVFVAQRWGSWIEYALPSNPVEVDSRIELFTANTWRDYLDVSAGVEGWQQTLDRWGVRVVALSPTQQEGLIVRIRHDPGWRLAFEDRDGLVFVRR